MKSDDNRRLTLIETVPKTDVSTDSLNVFDARETYHNAEVCFVVQ